MQIQLKSCMCQWSSRSGFLFPLDSVVGSGAWARVYCKMCVGKEYELEKNKTLDTASCTYSDTWFCAPGCMWE